MALQNTNLIVSMSPLPATFEGTPQELADEIIRRIRIQSASGTNFFYIGDTEPTSNVGPWLRGGTQWYVWNDAIKRYVPLDISASETSWFWAQEDTPSSSVPALWLRLNGSEPVGWYFSNGTSWVPFVGIPSGGTTAQRPTDPVELQRYYDTTISTEIIWERGGWRTVSGVPGDIKAVAFETLTEALQYNPGWEVLGAGNQSWRGRWISQATRDPGATPVTVLTVDAGIAQRAAHEVYGQTDGVQMNALSPVPYPPTIALWWLVKT